MASNPTLRTRLERVGMGSIHPVQGLTALAMALRNLNSTGECLISHKKVQLKCHSSRHTRYIENVL